MKWGKKDSTPAENWMPMVIDGHHYEYQMATNRIRADPPREYAVSDRENVYQSRRYPQQKRNYRFR
jgi:hypothetical protein